jgi:hypothetical protein
LSRQASTTFHPLPFADSQTNISLIARPFVLNRFPDSPNWKLIAQPFTTLDDGRQVPESVDDFLA